MPGIVTVFGPIDEADHLVSTASLQEHTVMEAYILGMNKSLLRLNFWLAVRIIMLRTVPSA